MKNISRNFVSIGLALALFGGISGMAFAQEAGEEPAEEAALELSEASVAEPAAVAEETPAEPAVVAVEETPTEPAAVAEETPEPTRWTAPSVSVGTGTFKIDVQTVFNGFVVTTPTKTYDEKKGELVDAGDTTIEEFDDEDWGGKIGLSASYDNSDVDGVGYSFGVGGGIRRATNFGGEFAGYFDSPWGKLFLLKKQVTLRAGGLEELWKAWDDNWDYGNYGGGVQLNINPDLSKLGLNLNAGISLPVPKDASKVDYPFKNLATGLKFGIEKENLPTITVSAALKLRGGHYNAFITAVEAATKTKDAATEAKEETAKALEGKSYSKDDGDGSAIWLEAKVAADAAAAALADAEGALEKATTKADLLDPLNESMDLNAALNFDLNPISIPIQIMAELQIADLNEELKGIAFKEKTGDTEVTRDPYFQFHPRLEISLSKIVDLGAFSLETFSVSAWIKKDPTYVSDGETNTELSVEWTPSFKLFEAGNTTLTASVFFGGYFNVWGGDPAKDKDTLEKEYAYNQVGFTLRPALEFKFGPNAAIRLRDQIKIQQTGVDPERGIENQVQVRFSWGF